MSLKSRIKELIFAEAENEQAKEQHTVTPACKSSAKSKKNGSGEDTIAQLFVTQRLFYYFLFALLFLALYLTYLLMQPFWHTIILACIFGALVHPLYTIILKKTGLRDYLASALTLAVVVVIFCIPLAFFLSQLIPQATVSIRDLAQWLSSNHLDSFINNKVFPLLTWLNDDVLTMVDIDVDDIRTTMMSWSRTIGQRLVGWGTGVVVDSITIFVNFLLMLLIMFFLLKDGKGMLKKLRQLSPLRAEQEESILQNLRRMAGAVLIGGFSVAAVQGFVGGIGLYIVDIPPLFWGSVMAAAALVPVVGTGLVWVPAVIYFAISGDTKSALFLLVWCGVLVTGIDSVLRPIIMRGSSKISLLFLFMSVFGGIKAFGPLGIVYGPLILSFVLAMMSIYSLEFTDLDKHKSGAAAYSGSRKKFPRVRRHNTSNASRRANVQKTNI